MLDGRRDGVAGRGQVIEKRPFDMPMNKFLVATAAIALGLGVAGCETNTGTGAAAGAARGAAAGAITGGSAVTGAAIGAAGGAVVGSAVDREVNSGKCFQRGVEVACPPE